LDQFSEVKPDAIRFMASLDLVNYFPNPGNDFGQKVLKKVEALEFHPLLEQLLVQRYHVGAFKEVVPQIRHA